MKKLLCLLLAVLMAVQVILCSCGDGSELTATETKTSEGPNRGGVTDNVPKLNYGGATVNILGREDTIYQNELKASKINGDPVNDAVYNRDNEVMSRLNVKIVHIEKPDPEFVAYDSAIAGLDEYQIVLARSFTLAKASIDNAYYNVLNKEAFPYLDFDQPWWSSYYIEQAKLGDQLYSLVGDYSLTWLKGMQATFFNKELVSQYNLPNLYSIVDSGEWTIDKQIELASKVYVDVTGDGKTQDDVFGFGFDDFITLDAYMSAFDMNFVSVDDTNTPFFDIDMNKHSAIVDKIYNLMYNTKYAYCIKVVDTDNFEDILKEKMANDELLFATMTLADCDSKILRDMKSDYGIIPVPKWNDEQKDYYSSSSESYSLIGIPSGVVESEMVSAVLELLAAESYRYVTPAYYNKVLRGQYMRDLESSKMLDLITSSYKTDFGVIYGLALDRVAYNTFRYYLRDGNNNISSYWKASQKRYNKYLEDLIKMFRSNAEIGN